MKCYLFDIDGTLADCEHRLHHIRKQPKDWRAYFAEAAGDTPIPHIIEIAKLIGYSGRTVIYVSGRSDECRAATLDWLRRHGLPDGTLFMRQAGDHTDDDILKSQMLDAILLLGFQPVMAFDDRDRVVKMWRERGIPCAQVAPGDF